MGMEYVTEDELMKAMVLADLLVEEFEAEGITKERMLGSIRELVKTMDTDIVGKYLAEARQVCFEEGDVGGAEKVWQGTREDLAQLWVQWHARMKKGLKK